MTKFFGLLVVGVGCAEAFSQTGAGFFGLGGRRNDAGLRLRATARRALPAVGRCGGLGMVATEAVKQEGDELYQPMIDSLLSIFKEKGYDLAPQELPSEDLAYRENVVGKGKREQLCSVTTDAYTTSKIRQVRLAHVCGGKDLQVLNFCIFPDTNYALPSFSADLVTLPDKHLIAIDAQPNGPYSEHAYADGGHLSGSFDRHKDKLPEGGEISAARSDAKQYMSKCFLWSKLPRDISDQDLVDAVLPAFEDYMRSYLDLVDEAEELTDKEKLESVLDAQLRYAHYRIDKDPARPVLTRMFGAEFTERLISDVLFDLPMKLGHKVEHSE